MSPRKETKKQSPKAPPAEWAEMGRRLLAARKALKMTQAELAQVLSMNGVSISDSAIGMYEKGKRRVTYDVAVILEKLHGKPAAYYLALLSEDEAAGIAAQRKVRREK